LRIDQEVLRVARYFHAEVIADAFIQIHSRGDAQSRSQINLRLRDRIKSFHISSRIIAAGAGLPTQ
jgi:hypothetical protein